MGQITTSEKKLMGDFEIALKVGNKDLRLKIAFGDDKPVGPETAVKSFYYYNVEKSTFTLSELYNAIRKFIIPLNDLPDLPSDGFVGSITTAEIGLYELYFDTAGQFGMNFSVKFDKNPLEGIVAIDDVEIKLNLAKVFVGSTGLVSCDPSIDFKLLPQDKTFNKIDKVIDSAWLEIKNNPAKVKFVENTYRLSPIVGTDQKVIAPPAPTTQATTTPPVNDPKVKKEAAAAAQNVG
jgi:hypothetical protein